MSETLTHKDIFNFIRLFKNKNKQEEALKIIEKANATAKFIIYSFEIEPVEYNFLKLSFILRDLIEIYDENLQRHSILRKINMIDVRRAYDYIKID